MLAALFSFLSAFAAAGGLATKAEAKPATLRTKKETVLPVAEDDAQDAAPDPEPETETTAKAETARAPVLEPEAAPEPEAVKAPEAVDATDPEPEPETVTEQAATEPESEPEAETEPTQEPDPIVIVAPAAKPATKSTTSAVTDTAPETAAAVNTPAETAAETTTEAVTETATTTKAPTRSATVTETTTDTATETVTETATTTTTKAPTQSTTVTETATDTATETATDTTTETGTTTKAATRSDTVTETTTTTPREAAEVETGGTAATSPEQGETVSYDATGTLAIDGGRVTTLDVIGSEQGAVVEITDLPAHGNATVNPDNTIALVLSGSDYSGPLSLGYTITHADGSTESVTAKFNVAAPVHEEGWGAGEHYMLETDENDDIVVETGDNHRKVYVTGSEDALTRADIAALEGIAEDDVTGSWLADHPEYGGSEEMALETDLGMELWYDITGAWPRVENSNWLLFEKGYTYEDIGQIISRGALGEDELHPMHITSWGEGDRPVLASELRILAEDSYNVVFSDVTFTEGALILTGENYLFDDVLITGNSFNLQNIDNVTIRNSEIMYVAKDEPSGTEWNAHVDREAGLFAHNIDGLLIEGNFIHHNAWTDGYDGTADEGMPPSMFSHSVYLQNTTTDVTFRDNIVTQAGSFGAQIRGGGFIEDNVFIDNNAAVNFSGGIYEDKGIGPIGNFTLFTDNLVTSGAHKDALLIGALTMGVHNTSIDATLLDNIIAHLADPNNEDEFEAKAWAHFALQNDNDTYYDDTIVYNWIASRYNDYEDLWDAGVNGISAADLNEITIQNYTAALLGLSSATITDLTDYLETLPDSTLDDTITADQIIAWFQAGFGVALNGDEAATDHRFVPNELGDGIRWDNRINWTTEDVPDDGDNVDLAGNWVTYNADTTAIGDLDLGSGGKLNVASGKLSVDGDLEAGENGGTITVDGSGQFWTDGHDDDDRLSIDVDGGRFANTGDFAGTSSLSVSDGQAILATENASYDVTAGSELRIEGSEAKVGFDGAQNGTAVLRMAEDAVLTFDADAEGVSTIEEFRSGHWDQDRAIVKSGAVLDGTLQIDLAGYTGGTGNLTLVAVDALAGAFDDIEIHGLSGAMDATVHIDYVKDQLRLELTKGSGQVDLQMTGDPDDASGEDAGLWAALTSGQGVYDEALPQITAEDEDLPDLLEIA